MDNFEAYFLDAGWLCIKGIDKDVLLSTLDIQAHDTCPWTVGHDRITKEVRSPTSLYLQIEDWHFVYSKYWFLDTDYLLKVLNVLSLASQVVYAFAIDMWSSYYCFAKSINGENHRFWLENDDELISAGAVTEEELLTTEIESVNRLLEIADKGTVPFQVIEDYLKRNDVMVLK